MSDRTIIDVFANANARGGEQFLVTDRFGRLRMSAGLVKRLSAQDTPIKMYLGYDAANKRIALGRVDVVKPTDAKPVSFDGKRHYAPVRSFIDKHRIPTERVRFVFDGTYEGWLMFRMEDYVSTDGRGR